MSNISTSHDFVTHLSGFVPYILHNLFSPLCIEEPVFDMFKSTTVGFWRKAWRFFNLRSMNMGIINESLNFCIIPVYSKFWWFVGIKARVYLFECKKSPRNEISSKTKIISKQQLTVHEQRRLEVWQAPHEMLLSKVRYSATSECLTWESESEYLMAFKLCLSVG